MFTHNIQGDSDVISSHHFYASCFPTTMWGKLWKKYLLLWHHLLSKIATIRTFS